jgi:hypothetical protein
MSHAHAPSGGMLQNPTPVRAASDIAEPAVSWPRWYGEAR